MQGGGRWVASVRLDVKREKVTCKLATLKNEEGQGQGQEQEQEREMGRGRKRERERKRCVWSINQMAMLFFGARPFFKVMRMPRGVCEVTGSRLEARGSLGGGGWFILRDLTRVGDGARKKQGPGPRFPGVKLIWEFRILGEINVKDKVFGRNGRKRKEGQKREREGEEE